MKKNIFAFISGMLMVILIIALAVPVLAAAGFTITVNTDMNILVNGNEFEPKNVNGEDVMVFEYEGTTYAPLRALAEAYGLEVGYSQLRRMAFIYSPTPGLVMYSEFPDAPDFGAHQEISLDSVAPEEDRLVYKYSCSLDNVREYCELLEKNGFIESTLPEDGIFARYYFFSGAETVTHIYVEYGHPDVGASIAALYISSEVIG